MASEYHEIETRIQQAVAHMVKNPDAKRAQTARKFNVPLQRLRSRLKGKPSKSAVSGMHGRRLSPDQELALEIYLRKMIEYGLHPRLNAIESAAMKLLMQGKVNSDEETSRPSPLGRDWSRRWMNRHNEFKKTKRKPLAATRKNAEDPQIIKNHFFDFRAAIQRHGVCQEDVWNFDETGFRLGIARSDWVLITSDDLSGRVLSKDPDNRKSMTAIECINTTGFSIPSFLILTGAVIMNSWVNNDLSDDVILIVADPGYSNDWLSLQWLKHFNTHSAKSQKGAYRLLLMDGYGSHHTIEFIEYCEENKIIPFGLPAHTTHLLQPLDVVVFQPLKHWHAEAVKNAMAEGDETFIKLEFLNAFITFRTQAFKKSTILSAWREVGLFPFNPDIVLKKLPRIENARLITFDDALDPEWSFDFNAETPKNLKQLMFAAYDLEQRYPEAYTVNKFARGALATARAEQLFEEQLAHTNAAENARKLRANQDRRSVQKGGVITVGKCRKMVDTRKVEEDRLKLDREMKQIRQRRARWGAIFRELVNKIPYYIEGHSYGLSIR